MIGGCRDARQNLYSLASGPPLHRLIISAAAAFGSRKKIAGMNDATWVTLARSALAALADGARTLGGSSAYEHVLIDFDEAAPRWYGAIEQLALKEPAALVELAEQATERVEMDGLRCELILAKLLDAWELDHA